MPDLAALSRAESLIASIPDHPQPGVVFRDLTPLFADADALRVTVEALVEPFEGQFDVVAGLEARGFLLAGAAAVLTGVGLVPLRKAGKLPRPAAKVTYDLEYGEAAIEAHDDIADGTRVLLLDDVLATGGTLAAGHELVATLGGIVTGASVVLEIDELGGRARSGDVHALFHV